MEKNKNKRISTKILQIYLLSTIVVGFIFFFLLPRVLNYPPDSINNAFQRSIDLGLLYNEQYFIIIMICIIICTVSIKFCTKKIDNLDLSTLKKYDKHSTKLVQSLFNLPYTVFFINTLIPSIMIVLVYALSEGSINFGTIKIALLIITICILIASAVFVYCKNLISKFLENISMDKEYFKKFTSLKYKIFSIIIPIVLVSLVFSSLIGYSMIVEEKGNYMFKANKITLDDYFQKEHYSNSEFWNTFNDLELLENQNDKFIIYSNDNYYSYKNRTMSTFFIKYSIEKSADRDGRTYDTYGIDRQGVVKRILLENQPVYIGISYDVTSDNTIRSMIISILTLFIIISFVLYYISKSLSEDIKRISLALNGIVHNSSNYETLLPITSNDEIAELALAFNDIQKLTKQHIEKIQNNQSQLVEQERLASLGQMIGGIAHNLKTPIMSISGAAEGLKDLTSELDNSIGNPVVTADDYHEIAKDMNNWIEKIKDYSEYMSDVITAVKGQAVNFANDQEISFTISELLKRVDILMKHELKNAIVYLNISVQTDENTVIKGDVNSLVQIINNMISNSIQAYEGKPEQSIDLIVTRSNSNCIISIKDYANGLPEKIKDKLFKEMITTKGKNGTGLGLYMSYSTIKAHFKGDITFESEPGKGTTFNIILPIY